MRVTMQSLYRNILTNLNRNNTEMNRINGQISSGKQMSKISDNPVNLVNALGLRTNLAELGQYQKNLKYGTTLISASENTLTSIKDLVMRAKTLAIQQANAPMTPENRKNAALEVKNLWEQAITLANSAVNGKYIFAGYRTTGYTPAEPAPFVQGARDGYFISGAHPMPDGLSGSLAGNSQIDNSSDLVNGNLLINGHDVVALHDKPHPLTTTIDFTANLAGGDFAINGVDIGAVDLIGIPTNEGLNMAGAQELRTAINGVSENTGVTAHLTTLAAGTEINAANLTIGDTISLTVNGAAIDYEVTGDDVSDAATFAANLAGEITSTLNARDIAIEAVVGDGSNGGASNTLVFRNTGAGDESSITIADLAAVGFDATDLGLDAIIGENSVGAGNNTGEVTLLGDQSYLITTGSDDDTILGRVGLSSPDGDGQIQTVPAIDLTQPPTYGINMASANALATALNDPAVKQLTGVSAGLTTLASFAPAENNATWDGEISFTLNGEQLTVPITSGATPEEINAALRGAINAVSDLTGVVAATEDGNGNNGADEGYLILRNIADGDDDDIVISDFAANGTDFHMEDGDYNVQTGNTGVVSLSGENSFTLTTSATDDSILALLGLDGGNLGFADVADDGILRYGPALQEGDLKINGATVSTRADGISTIYADSSATAKAAAINDGDYAIEAQIEPAWHMAAGAVWAEEGELVPPTTLGSGDLRINNIDIFTGTTEISNLDSNNALVQAINSKSGETGVNASRNDLGHLILSAVDGRNIHVQTSAKGEKVSRLTGSTQDNGQAAPGNQVYFGSIRLLSDQSFKLESDIVVFGDENDENAPRMESGFAAMGLSGGSTVTGESADQTNDGQLLVNTIHRDSDYVRYAGDRNNDIKIKVGQRSTIEISKNGNDAIFETGVFQILKELEDFLGGDKFNTATSAAQAVNAAGAAPRSNLQVTLDSGGTGLELAERIGEGTFSVTVTNHGTVPPSPLTTKIKVDPANDTLEDIASRLNGIPGLEAAWSDSGFLTINTTDPERYSFDLSQDSSGLLNAVGLEPENLQVSSLQKSIADLDGLMNELTNHVSDFGARANRIEVQTNIYMNLNISTAENLSELEDTDLIEAIMALQAKELAYQASLNAAAKTMQMSLLDFL